MATQTERKREGEAEGAIREGLANTAACQGRRILQSSDPASERARRFRAKPSQSQSETCEIDKARISLETFGASDLSLDPEETNVIRLKVTRRGKDGKTVTIQ